MVHPFSTVLPAMKLILPAALGLALFAQPVPGQTLDENLKPKTPPPKAGKTKLDTPAAPTSSPEDEVQVTANLKGLVFLRSKEDIKREGMDGVTGVEVRDIPLIGGADFAAALNHYLGQPAKLGTLKAIQRDVIVYCRSHDRPLVDVIVPNQEVNPTNGVIQIVLVEGRIGKVTVQNEGRKWFTDESISRSVRLQPGDPISEKKLLADIDWINRNPFREVTPSFRQGEQPGLSDMQLDVRDRIPIRVFAGYEDSGTEATGRDRLLAGFNWGDAFLLGHQLNYQYSTDAEFDTLKAHSVSYIAPLPWRHTLSVYGTYVDINSPLDTNFNSTAINYQAALRYAVPLPILKDYQHEAFVGLDFKHNETDLLFGGTSVDPTETEVLQLVVGYNGSMKDSWGQTSAGLQGFFSPGDITDQNTDSAFDTQHKGAEANYYYGRLTVERVTRLPWNMSWIVRGGGQLANGNLIPSEQLGVGGYNTVRGYDEREANGDQGFVVSTEFRSPAFTVLGRNSKWKVQDQLQFLAFMDYGQTRNVNPDPAEVTEKLWSVGGGLRYTISRYLTFRFDYGVQLRDSNAPVPSDYGSRAHIGVIASF
jgi:hemolysin activation/secretion protein